MFIPEILIFYAANKVRATVIAYPFFIKTVKVWDVVEEVERKEDHGCDDPLEGEYGKKKILVPFFTTYLFEQQLHLVLLLVNQLFSAVHQI